MRTRILPLAGLLLLAAPALTRAAPAEADDRPAVVVAFKSLDGLISDAKYVAGLAGKDNEAQQFEAVFKKIMGRGLSAIDAKKPIGLYARINADDPQASEVVLLLPVVSEDGLVSLVKNIPNLTVKDKDSDGVYKVVSDNFPVPVYFRFANDYAYATVQNKEAIAKDRLIAPDKVLPSQGTSLASLTVHADAIPEKYKDLVKTGVAQGLAQAKQQEQPGETPSLKAFRLAAIDEVGAMIRSVVDDGSDLTVSLDVDQDKGELSASATFSAKPGSPLADSISELATKKSVSASLRGKDSAANLIVNVALPEKVRESGTEMLIEAFKNGLANAPHGDELADMFIKAASPTLKAGELDVGFDLRGPGDKGLYTLLTGLKIRKGADVEKLLRDLLKGDPSGKSLKLDVAKAGDVSIHQIIPDQPLDDNVKRLIGENPDIYFAIRDDAILLAGGPDALSVLKEAATAKPKAGPTVQVEVSMGRAAQLVANENPDAPAIAKKVFTKGVKDKFRVSVQGGKALTVKLSMDAAIVTFSAQLQEAQQNK